MNERPEPAVGQVWQRLSGVQYAIIEGDGISYAKMYTANDVIHGFDSLWHVIDNDDTYRGKLAGFKVQEEGGK